MCFSAPASFTAAAVIGAVGAAALRKAGGGDRRLVFLAAFPVLFAFQQLVEGFLWLELAHPEPRAFRPLLVHLFQGYAEVFWPVFAPLTAFLIEPVAWRRRVIAGCLIVGVILAGYLLIAMIGHPYFAFIAGSHIVYKNDFDYPVGIEVPYVLATTISLLLSSRKPVQTLGVVILIGFFIAYMFVQHAYISVWCFFAAAASVMVYLHISDVSQPDAVSY